jgi:hypothetical protein
MKMPGKIWFAVLFLVIWAVIRLSFFVPYSYAASSPSLGTAENYSVIAGNAVTNTGITSISGNMGISPGVSPPNFTDSGTLTSGGTVHDADAGAATAQGDSGTAYTALNAQGCDIDYGAVTTDLAGKDYSPGVYCSSVFTLTGTLTLTGGADDVWIFKSGGNLTTTGASAKVVFSSGGNACNVWWYVPGVASLDASSALSGTIIANTSIALGNGATLDGRAFATTADVALNTNTISGPTCVAGSPSEAEDESEVLGEDTTCFASEITTTPSIIETKRISPTSIFVNWGPYEGIENFLVEYGVKNGEWVYNTPVSGFEITINDLPSNQPIWFRVAGTNDCAVGAFSTPVQYGSAPLLPNSGLSQKKSTSPWVIAIAIVFPLTSLFFLRAQIKRLFSFKR